MDAIRVSVMCTAYNHEKYIKDAIEGFLEQKTDFKYEVIIHDDASTDRTADIVKSYEKDYPKIIHGIYQKENQYNKGMPYLLSVMRKYCRGKYIALCEGDDYWIDSHKLQMQVDYLEQHPECVLSVHDAVKINFENDEVKAMHPYEDGDILPDALIMQYNGILPTNSMVFQREILDIGENSFFLKAGAVGDYPLQLYCLTKGKIHYSSRIMSVYRYMHQGSWSANVNSDLKNKFIHAMQILHFLNEYNKYTDNKYCDIILKRKRLFMRMMLKAYLDVFLSDFCKDCERYDIETKSIYHEEFTETKRLFLEIFGMGNICHDIKRFRENCKCIYIMGAGNFAGIIARQLGYCNIDFKGFLVSGEREFERIYLEKPVKKLDEIVFDPDEDGIVIGINFVKWGDITGSLDDLGMTNYMIPSLLRSLIKMEQ